MRLFIAEKTELAEAICAVLGGGFATKDGYFEKGNDVVTWCYGHMLQLFDPQDYDEKYKKWSFDDLPFAFIPIKRKFDQKRIKQIKIIRDLLVKADTIVNAGDPDEEGQLIVDELLRHFNCQKPVQRVLINDNNTKVVAKAIANMKPNSEYEHLGYKAEARSIADQLCGYNLTRAYTLNSQAAGGQGVISIGRVQTPILGLVVRRDRENQAHKKVFYYDVLGSFDIDGVCFDAVYKPMDTDPTIDNGKLADKAKADEIANSCTGSLAKIISLETEEKQTPSPLPYNLLKLQQDASRKFGLNPDKTLAITQSLREKHKLITYNRSDCQYLSDEQFEDAGAVLAAIANTATVFSGVVAKADASIKGRVFNSKKVSAHHAIIPTETVVNIESLSEQEKNIYLIIARAYIAQFYPDYTFDSTNLLLDVNAHKFKVTAKVDKQLGWKVLYKNDKDNEETQNSEGDDIDLRGLTNNATGNCIEALANQKETKPPALYTMPSLLGDLTRVAKYVKDPVLAKVLKEKDKDKAGEHGGIGTPATRSSIIKTLFERGFLAEQKKKIISTELGQKLYDTLDDLVRFPDMTAKWHEDLKNIQTQDDVYRFVRQIMSELVEPEIERLKATKIAIADVFECPKCNRPMRRNKGKHGWFWGCTGYRDEVNPCKHIMNDKGGKPVEKKSKSAVNKTDFDCKACGNKLILREGKSKKTKKKYKFFGCSNYPECKQTYFEKEGKPNYEKE